MKPIFNEDGWTTLRGKHALVEFTEGELRAVQAAIGSYLNAATADECRVVFGSEAGTRAAAEASSRIVRAGNALGAWSR